MTLSANQYLAVKRQLRSALSGTPYAPAPNLSEAGLLSFWAQLLADSVGAAALTQAQVDAVTATITATLSPSIAVLSTLNAADWLDFISQIGTESSGASSLPALQHAAHERQFRAVLSGRSVTPMNLSQDQLRGYFSPYAFSPATLALVQWFDGRATAYSDAGTTVATVPFGRIQQIAQPYPLSGNWAGTTTARPVREVNGADFRAAEVSKLVGPALAATTPANAHTIAISFQMRAPSQISTVYSFTDPGGGTTGISTFGNGIYYSITSILKGPIAVLPSPVGPGRVNIVIRFNPGGQDWKGDIDGAPFSGSDSNAPSAGNFSTAMTLGSATGRAFASVSQALVSNLVVSDANRDALLSYLQANTVQLPPMTAPLVAIAGDSISVGYGISVANSYTAYVPQTQLGLVGNPTQPRLMNGGFPGATIADMVAQYPSLYAPLYSASRAKNILVWQVQTNDLNCNTGSEATQAAVALAAYYAACDQSKAGGWLNVLCTCLPSTASYKGTGFDAARLIFNADVIANYAAHGAALSDFGNASGMAVAADANGVNFQADHLHVTTAGYAIMAGVLTPVITALL